LDFQVAACESLEATAAVAPEFWNTRPSFPLVMGIDFGRHRDLSVAWSLAQLGDVQQTVEVLELDRTPTWQVCQNPARMLSGLRQ
jgi:phage FluMu gp28-like protein